MMSRKGQARHSLKYYKATFRVCLLICSIILSSHKIFSQNNAPNIVVIMADDLGYYDVGFNRIHAADQSNYGIIPTPQVDRIAQSGATCTRGYVAHPFCGPSRAALLTGRYPHEVGSQYNLPNGSIDCNGQDVGFPIGPDSEFFSTVLQQQGNYTTYMTGKWHAGYAQQFDPISRGFTEYYGFLGGGHQYFPAGDPSQGINSSNQIAANQNNTGINDYFKYIEKNRQFITDESRYVTRAISEETVNFIRQSKQAGKPFLAYVAYNAPHTPLQAPLPDKNQFLIDNPNFRSNIENSPDILNANSVVNAPTAAERQAKIDELIEDRITYATMVTIMDEGIGQILDELQSNNNGGSVFDNTIVIFLSDNGGKLREAGGVNYPLDRGKGAVNEGGFRVPFCISWPDGGIQANTIHPYPVSSLDIYPSLLAAANIPIPDRLDGQNILENVSNTSPTLRSNPLYILRHFNGFSNVSILDNVAGSDKKITKKANGSWRYYDLASDIAETTDLNNGATATEAQTLFNRLVPKVRILVEQHLQPLFFDKCEVQDKWVNNNMPRFQDGSNRPQADTPDETFFLDCYATLSDSDNDGICNELDLCPQGDDMIDINANGIPDTCDSCSSFAGIGCDDGDPCTTDDQYDTNCNCIGIPDTNTNNSACNLCIDIQLSVFLEGAYSAATNQMTTELNTVRGLLPGQTPTSALIAPTPAGQPYNTAPWNYAGTEGAGWTDADYTGNETDWILVSFRTGVAKNTELTMTAALLMKDGVVEFPDRCALPSTVTNPVYIVVEHRNHIGVMTPQPVDIIGGVLTYDFRLTDSYRDPTSFGQKQLPTGEWVLFAGDADQSDFPSFDIKGTDKTIWFDNNGVFDYYFSPDFNLDGDINGQDKSLWFDNNGISSRVPK